MTDQQTRTAIQTWLREHFTPSFGDPKSWTEAQHDEYHTALGMAYAMVCDLELTVKE